jgi:BolA family transcriptional regulator, general stress-responsive regulator
MSLSDEIHERLQTLQPTALKLQDESALHAGHAGNQGGGHFRLYIVSAQFHGKSMLARHRMVYQSLAGMIPERIHALSIQAFSIEEAPISN